MANQRNLLTGDMSTVEDKAVSISIERYNELIKKEVLFDELSKDGDVLVLVSAKIFNKEEN